MPKPFPPQNYDKLIEEIHKSLDKYKSVILSGSKERYPSDIKKLLALPFLMTRQVELPEPKKG
jgi:nitroimidazol reductase NimA-like FMN-containing flavoprotein (pyridoxamine 5'-phosphate oxidase superfamily)